MKSISQIAEELNINRHTIYQMILRNDIQPDEIGKNRVKLYDVQKEYIIKDFFQDNSQDILKNNEISQENHLNTKLNNSQDILEQSKTSKQDNLSYIKLSQELQDKLDDSNNQIEFLKEQCNNLMEQNSKLLSTIQDLQQANRELQQTSAETIKDIQKNNADTIQALKNSQILHAETMKAEILALNDSSNQKAHWWQFWKR